MLSKLINFGRMIKFSHSIFALPFAFSAVILALESSLSFNYIKIVWILICMVSARTSAMAFNRFIDKEIDAKNPRTKSRELVTGVIGNREVIFYIFFSCLIFAFSSYQINKLCFYLSPIALIVILGYSYTKRFTWLCHFILGLGLALSPLGAWLAVKEQFELIPIILGLGVFFWVSGFDIIYACQDFEFDKSIGLHSIPAFFGLNKSLIIAKLLHIFAFILFASLYVIAKLHFSFLIGLIIIGVLFFYQHRIVSVKNLSKINIAFFNLNGIISMAFFMLIMGHHILSNN
jgi:4-hydroxybenzoate polyprenyltransferase